MRTDEYDEYRELMGPDYEEVLNHEEVVDPSAQKKGHTDSSMNMKALMRLIDEHHVQSITFSTIENSGQSEITLSEQSSSSLEKDEIGLSEQSPSSLEKDDIFSSASDLNWIICLLNEEGQAHLTDLRIDWYGDYQEISRWVDFKIWLKTLKYLIYDYLIPLKLQKIKDRFQPMERERLPKIK